MQNIADNDRQQPAIRDRGTRDLEKKTRRLERLVVEYVAPDDLKPNSYNPNRQNDRDFELLIKSIKEDGFTQPVVCLLDGTIVDGEHRWRAALHLKYVKIPVVRVDMTPEQMRVSTLRHNRARGSEDVNLSAEVLRDLRELGALEWAKDSLMMDEDEMNKLLADIPVTEALAGEEFSEAWMPAKSGINIAESGVRAGNETVSASTGAVTYVQDMTARIQNEDDDNERDRLMQEMNKSIFRISVSFAGDEALIIQAILGETPAQNLLEICKTG